MEEELINSSIFKIDFTHLLEPGADLFLTPFIIFLIIQALIVIRNI